MNPEMPRPEVQTAERHFPERFENPERTVANLTALMQELE